MGKTEVGMVEGGRYMPLIRLNRAGDLANVFVRNAADRKHGGVGYDDERVRMH